MKIRKKIKNKSIIPIDQSCPENPVLIPTLSCKQAQYVANNIHQPCIVDKTRKKVLNVLYGGKLIFTISHCP
jgi:hypothetical protein